MANAADRQFLLDTNWPNYLENIVTCLDKKCSGLSNYKWGYFMDLQYIELNNPNDGAYNNCNIGYIYCKNNLPLRFRFKVQWQNELRITVDTIQYGEAISFEEHTNLPTSPLDLQNYNHVYKQVKLSKKPSLIANDVISLLVSGEETIKTLHHKIEQYVTKTRQLGIGIDKIKSALNLTDDYLQENYRESACKIYLRHVGSVEMLKDNLCRINTTLYLSTETLIALIQMIDKETQELGKSPSDRYYSR